MCEIETPFNRGRGGFGESAIPSAYESNCWMAKCTSHKNALTITNTNTTAGSFCACDIFFPHMRKKGEKALSWPELLPVNVRDIDSGDHPVPLVLCFYVESPPPDSEIQNMFSILWSNKKSFYFTLTAMAGQEMARWKQTRYRALTSPFASTRLDQCAAFH